MESTAFKQLADSFDSKGIVDFINIQHYELPATVDGGHRRALSNMNALLHSYVIIMGSCVLLMLLTNIACLAWTVVGGALAYAYRSAGAAMRKDADAFVYVGAFIYIGVFLFLTPAASLAFVGACVGALLSVVHAATYQPPATFTSP